MLIPALFKGFPALSVFISQNLGYGYEESPFIMLCFLRLFLGLFFFFFFLLFLFLCFCAFSFFFLQFFISEQRDKYYYKYAYQRYHCQEYRALNTPCCCRTLRHQQQQESIFQLGYIIQIRNISKVQDTVGHIL